MAEPGVVVFAYHDVGVECLNALVSRGSRVLAVFTHRDNPEEKIWFRSVAQLARQHGIPVHTPDSVNTPEWIARLREIQPDIIFFLLGYILFDSYVMCNFSPTVRYGSN